MSRKMFVAIAVALLVVAGLAAFFAFSTKVVSSTAVASEPVSFTGAWTAQVNESTFVTTITDEGIEIQWKQGDDISALYWKGTFPIPAIVADGTVIVSIGDTKTMSESLLASQDESKAFTYDRGKLSFKFKIMGVTQTVYLKRSADGPR